MDVNPENWKTVVYIAVLVLFSFSVYAQGSDPCSSYINLADPYRNVLMGRVYRTSGIVNCDRSRFNPGGWYRYTGAAGDMMPERCVPKYTCGTHAPMWLQGTHPGLNDGIVSRNACAHWNSDCCYWSTTVNVKMCPGDYYIYQLPSPPACHLTYCGVPYSWNRRIRLVGGVTPNEGRVEVFHDDEWGTICDRDRNWDNMAAETVCATLGYGSSGARAASIGTYGTGRGVIWMADTQCDGGERSIFRCTHSEWGETAGCTHSDDVAVDCSENNLPIGDGYAYFEKCINNTCYIEDELDGIATVQEARKTCQSYGGDLAIFETEQESTAVTGIIRNGQYRGSYLVIGAILNSGVWKWYNGEVVPSAVISWDNGQPDAGDEQHMCISTGTSRWHDCPMLSSILCEIKYPVSCSDFGCCLGRNSSCKVELRSCYCDEYCLEAGDCCDDFLDTCSDPDRCFAHTTIKNEVTRSAMYRRGSDEAAACDANMADSWYRFEMVTGNDMPVTCDFEGDCGTDNAIWVNGSLPTVAEGVVNRTACVRNSTSCCAKTYDIEIKNCTTFNVYHLSPVDQCSERYCIGDKVLCPPGMVSEDGFEPGCSDKFPNITQQPDIAVGEGIKSYIAGNIPKREIVFKCMPRFDGVPEDKQAQLFFDMSWVIDSEQIHQENDINVTDLPAELKENEWMSKSISLGFQVKCKVRAKYVQNGTMIGARSAEVESDDFFAGIKMLNDTDLPIRIKENDPYPAIIAFQPTVPILCTDIPALEFYCEDVDLHVEVRIPQSGKRSLCPSDGGDRQRQETVLEAYSCGFQINAKNWNKTVIFKIAPVIDGVYDGDQLTTVILSTSTFNTHQAWSNYRLPDIPILVIDTDVNLEGRMCFANSDPHMRTFDGLGYECQLPGEFIMLKHQTFPIQVNSYFTTCNNGRAFCPCAVTVRSGNDLFIVDSCRKGAGHETTRSVKQPMRVGLLGCEHEQMRIKTSNGGKKYEIFLPTGGHVEVRTYYYIDDYYMNVHIHPGTSDFEATEGLCGTLNGNRNDDFKGRDGRTYPVERFPNNFSLTWRVPTDESIYNGIPATSLVSSVRSEYCRCPIEITDQVNPAFNSTVPVECGYTENVDKCLEDDSYSKRQLEKCRRRRATDGTDHDDILETRKFEVDLNYTIPNPVWRNGWTQDKADLFCGDYLYNSSSGKACQAVGKVDFDVALKGCIEDIKLTGDTKWAIAALGPIKAMCYGELSKNESYWVVDNSTGKVSLPEELDAVKCPNDCSKNGVCQNGTCICDPDFTSEDCSLSSEAIPILYRLPTDGVCDTRKRPCQNTPVYGRDFLQSSNLTCKFEQGTTSGVKTEYSAAEYEHVEEVTCPFPRSRRRRSDISGEEVVKVYNVSISNDGTNFSEPLKVIVFDSKCYACDGASGCNLLNGTCSINGLCFNEDEQNPADACQICNPNVSTSDWYHKPSTCTIDGRCYQDGEVKTGSSCQVCSSDENRYSWVVKNGTCFVNNACYNISDRNPTEPCQMCDPIYSKEQWLEQNGTCSINGSCYNETQHKPSSPCEICDPSLSNRDWTILNNTCEIDGKCISNQESRVDQLCHICDPATSATTWSIKADTCRINGSCYNHTQHDPSSPCQICDPTVSLTEWTRLNDTCEIDDKCISDQESRSGLFCHVCYPAITRSSWSIKNGTCSINGSCYNETQKNPSHSCQICDPSVSQTQWTDLNATCSINGSCFNESQQNPANPCQICLPGVLLTEWSVLNTTCFIDGQCFNSCQVNPLNDSSVCHPNISVYNWTSKSLCGLGTDLNTADPVSGNPPAALVALGVILGFIFCIALALSVAALIRFFNDQKNNQKRRETPQSKGTTVQERTSPVGYVYAHNTRMLRGNGQLIRSTSLGKDHNLGYTRSSERTSRGQYPGVSRGNIYVTNPASVGKDNRGYVQSPERENGGYSRHYSSRDRFQPVDARGRPIYIPPTDY